MSAIEQLIATAARLRAPDGCPWDREQTHQSICDCLVEEVAELLETIDRYDIEHMREELGDVLFHVVIHAQMASEAGHFDFEAVAAEVNEKLIRRHPHVFGEEAGQLKDSQQVLKRWDEIKATEKKRGASTEGVFKHLPPALPSTIFARELYKQIQKKKLDTDGAIDTQRINELAGWVSEEKAGKMFFEIIAACQEKGIDPETALRKHATSLRDKAVTNAEQV